MLRLLLFLLLPGLLHAHQIAEIPMSLQMAGGKIRGSIAADAAYMLPEFRGDEDEEARDLAWLRSVGPDGWRRIEIEAEIYWKECLTLLADGTALASERETGRVLRVAAGTQPEEIARIDDLPATGEGGPPAPGRRRSP